MTSASTNPAPNDAPDPGAGLMPTRLAGILGLVAFAYVLLVGLFEADNGFATIVLRAVVAMAGTVAVGYVVGWMAQAMLNENLRAAEAAAKEEGQNPEDPPKDSATDGR